jgi:hypothetical protein
MRTTLLIIVFAATVSLGAAQQPAFKAGVEVVSVP